MKLRRLTRAGLGNSIPGSPVLFLVDPDIGEAPAEIGFVTSLDRQVETDAVTVYAVGTPTADLTRQYIMDGAVGGGRMEIIWYWDSARWGMSSASGISSDQTFPGGLPTPGRSLVTAVFGGADSRLRIDGETLASGNVDDSGPVTDVRVASHQDGTSGWTGTMELLIVYGEAHDLATNQAIEEWITRHYPAP